MSAHNLDDDEIIARAKTAYYRRSRRDSARGIHWPIIAERAWYLEEDDAGRTIVSAIGGFSTPSEIARWHWTGERLISVKPSSAER